MSLDDLLNLINDAKNNSSGNYLCLKSVYVVHKLLNGSFESSDISFLNLLDNEKSHFFIKILESWSRDQAEFTGFIKTLQNFVEVNSNMYGILHQMIDEPGQRDIESFKNFKQVDYQLLNTEEDLLVSDSPDVCSEIMTHLSRSMSHSNLRSLFENVF